MQLAVARSTAKVIYSKVSNPFSLKQAPCKETKCIRKKDVTCT